MTCRYQLRRLMLNPGSAAAIDLINLDKDTVKFGRNPDQVHVVLHSNLCPNMISREHAYIRQNRNNDGSISYYLCDTSLNGTYVNDIRVNSQILLHPGDTVKFGHVNGAAMAPGQPAPQPYAEFAYTFEKVPRSTSAQVQSASAAAQQVQAVAAYDAARRLAASPHSWSANPYAQLAAGPAAAYFAATGFNHPYLSHIPPGLLTPPPSAAAAAAAASVFSTTTTCTGQSGSVTVTAFPGGCATYPGMVGGSSATPMAANYHQQAPQFRPSSAIAAAAAEAAVWFAAGQGNYQHHQPVTSASPFTLGHLNPSSTPASSAVCPLNAPVSSIAQHQQQQLHQQYQQQEIANQNRGATGSTPFPNRATAEMDALASLSMLQKRQEQQQQQSLTYSSPIFVQQPIRPQQYSMPVQCGTNMGANDTTISNQTATVRKPGLDRIAGDYMHVQSQTDVRPMHSDQQGQHQRTELRKNMPQSPSDCEILPPPPAADRERFTSTNISTNRHPSGGDVFKANSTHNAPVRESVLVEAQSVGRTFGGSSACVATMTTTAARMKQSSVKSPPIKESQSVSTALSPTTAVINRGELRKAECDSSVPSPPEDPVRRKSTGTSSAATVGNNTSDDILIIDHHQSLNHDLLRLAADARTRCLDNNQDDVFDLEPSIGADPRRSDGASEKTSSTSSSSSSSSSDQTEINCKPTLFSSPNKTPVANTKSASTTVTETMAADDQKPPDQQQQQSGVARLARRKQRSNEVKRLFDDLQASYLFSQGQKKSTKMRSSDSQSSSEDEEEETKAKKKKDSVTSDSSPRSRSVDSEEAKEKLKTKKKPAIIERRSESTLSSPSASSTGESSDEKTSDSDEVLSKKKKPISNQKSPPKKTGSRTRGTPANRGGGGNARNRNNNGDRTDKDFRSRSRGASRGSRKSRGGGPARRSAPVASVSSMDSGDEHENKRRRKANDGTTSRARNRRSAPGGRGGRGQKKGGKSSSPDVLPAFIRPEDAWKFHDPSQECAAANNCEKPAGDEVDWVECDDCERWFHVNCVGCVFDEVKDEDTAFHCGCKD